MKRSVKVVLVIAAASHVAACGGLPGKHSGGGYHSHGHYSQGHASYGGFGKSGSHYGGAGG